MSSEIITPPNLITATGLLNEKEVARLIGMSTHWLRRKRWEGGGIPYIKLSGGNGAVRYRSEDVINFVESRCCTNTSHATVSQGG
ncbi:helix-turn-helix transcriptional regulator [Geobacter benzoatilyticus]|uniref:Helix-turn-helix domain-containing protein n=1 Tax=Geobacter benzoatilyticus TaxID=2815309 RepID=A0ABX7Q521_9BACT|nr:helix-turn-helix domain-containing protein [Geobacter benzoatilyticus]QSV46080.1 helix-turn-helix domain-containing protein [Geobacter benzoatilyticus]